MPVAYILIEIIVKISKGGNRYEKEDLRRL